jgi:hypothetical protein
MTRINRSSKPTEFSRAALLSKRPKVRAETLQFLRTSVAYMSSDEIYSNSQIYHDFLSEEIGENANFGRQIAQFLVEKNPKVFLETCSGPGVMIRDMHKDYPGAAFICADVAEVMVSEGQKLNPHLTFIKVDVTDRRMVDQVVVHANRILDNEPDHLVRVDAAFNSVSSLGFMTVEQLDEHLGIMHDLLNPDGGQYFADFGYYTSLTAASINSHHLGKGRFDGKSTWDWTVTVRYFPLADFHEITWSSWTSSDPSRLLFAASHKLRAYRASELAYIAHKRGLGFRLWRFYSDDKSHRYHFEEIGPDFCMQFEDHPDFLCEFYRGDPGNARLDKAREARTAADVNT